MRPNFTRIFPSLCKTYQKNFCITTARLTFLSPQQTFCFSTATSPFLKNSVDVELEYGGRQENWETFSALGLHPALEANVARLGYSRQTPVQMQSIPEAMAGKDILMAGVTGSGKTAAFLLPLIHSILKKSVAKGLGLVLCPTAELAEQTSRVARELSQGTNVSCATIHGGNSQDELSRLDFATIVVISLHFNILL
jgi:superfamily II DNA/RNA helicase